MRRLLCLGSAGLLLALTVGACNSKSSTPTAPSPAPAATPAPAPTQPPPAPPPPEPPPPPPPPPAAAELSSLSLSQSSVPGQGQPTGTITLTAAAPSGGAVVRLESSLTDVARVPSSVTVPAGATTATFRVDTSTVPTRATATITATYAGIARTATLIVTLPTPRASFTITSPTYGSDACGLINGGRELDCRLDARSSDGVLVRWSWVIQVVERIVTQKTDPIFAEIDTECRLVASADSSSDGRGKYVNMTISLEVQDRDGTNSPTTSRTVKLYTNANCGF